MIVRFVVFLLVTPLLLNQVFYYTHSVRQRSYRIADSIRTMHPQFVAIGSSRAEAGLHPEAFPGDLRILSLSSIDATLLSSVARNFAPDLKGKLLLEITREMFILQTLKQLPQHRAILASWGVPRALSGPYIWERHFWTVGNLLPHLAESRLSPGRVYYIIRNSPQDAQSLEEHSLSGFAPRRSSYSNMSNPKLVAEQSVQLKKKHYSKSLVEFSIKNWQEMIQFLEDQSVDFCLVSFPVTNVYNSEWVDYDPRVDAFVQDQTDKYGCLSGDVSIPLGGFADVDHLNVKGAMKFFRDIELGLTIALYQYEF